MRRFFLLSTFAVLSAVGACGGDSPTQPGSVTISGTYDLKTINGSPLPYIVAQSGADKIEEMSDVITANAGAFTQLTTVRVTQSGQVTTQSLSDAGTFTLNGTAATFQFQSDGSTGTATVSSGSFTVADNGYTYYYVKR